MYFFLFSPEIQVYILGRTGYKMSHDILIQNCILDIGNNHLFGIGECIGF